MCDRARERLPNRREHEAISFRHGNFAYVGGVGRFADGRLAEIFLNCGKAGTEIETVARDAAVVASIALQHGATADEIRDALTRDTTGQASGPLGALLDLLAAERTP